MSGVMTKGAGCAIASTTLVMASMAEVFVAPSTGAAAAAAVSAGAGAVAGFTTFAASSGACLARASASFLLANSA